MQQLLDHVAKTLVNILQRQLPKTGDDWWQSRVIDRLSIPQQRLASSRNVTALSKLDLAGLLRIFDSNWNPLGVDLNLDQQARNWLKETQAIRNRWAHLPPGGLLAEDVYRDADTIERLLSVLGAETIAIEYAAEVRELWLKKLIPTTAPDNPAEIDHLTRGGITKGTVVRLKARPTITGVVLDVVDERPEARFLVFQDGALVQYYESQIEIFNIKISRNYVDLENIHSAMTAIHLRNPSINQLYSLHASRINFVPYQFRPVLKLIQSDRPRILIADEVGVGKTIEAGLILKELQARREIKSVLVICPKPLVAERKWMEELKRFDEQFVHLDGPSLRYCIDETHLDGVWPQQYSRSIVPYSLFDEALLFGRHGKSDKKIGLLELDPPPVFDLIIVDEAHHIRNTDSWAYRNVRYFCDNAEAVVLMSATPIQLGSNDLYNLLHLARPDLLPSRREFDLMAEPNPHINAAIDAARNAVGDWSATTKGHLEKALKTSWGGSVLSADPRVQPILDRLASEDISKEDRLSVISELEALYTFASIINRTRRRDIGNFTTRKPETVSVAFTPDQARLHQSVLELVSKILMHRHGDKNLAFMMTTIRRQVASCVFGLAPYLQAMLSNQLDRLELGELDGDDYLNPVEEPLTEMRSEVEKIIHVAKNLSDHDPKFDAFAKVVSDKQALLNNKILMFSTFRHTLKYLTERLGTKAVRVGLIHGDVPEHERRQLRHRFSLAKDNPRAIDLLLSSEVGCEGLDFQFCDSIINYDLPWNPMRVEQRIGRIDRYGQASETVAIYNFVTPGTVDAEIYERCLLRIGVFRQALGGSEEILGKLTREIHNIADNLQLTIEEQARRLQQLSDNEVRDVQEQARLEEQQEKLFGLDVPNSDKELITSASNSWISPDKISGMVERYLNSLEDGARVYSLKGKHPVISLQLKQEVRNKLISDFKEISQAGTTDRVWESWLKAADPHLRLTFIQEAADEDRDAMFITPMHPLARQAARSLQPTTTLQCVVSSKSAIVPPGRYPFAIYRWKILGSAETFLFQPICEAAPVQDTLLELLHGAVSTNADLPLDVAEEDRLEALHYRAWVNRRSAHIETAIQSTQVRMASLSATHHARVELLSEQRVVALDDRIRRMKTAQIDSANSDFDRRYRELERASGEADIVADLAVIGIIYVEQIG